VLFEGAQGTMLDIDHGTYPFVTSSSATSAEPRRAWECRRRSSTRAGNFQGVYDARGQRAVSDGDAGPGCARKCERAGKSLER